MELKPLREFVKERDLYVVAHRGASGLAPENTLASFREAVNSGVKMIELDVQFTSDGKIIVFHDENLDRTTNNNNGYDELTYENIKTLDAGSWFSGEFSGERIPLLSEALDFLKDKAYLVVEIKAYKSAAIEKKMAAIVGMVDEYGMGEHTLYVSFNYKALTALKKINPSLPTAALKLPNDDTLPSEISEKTGCEAYICSVDELNAAIADDIKSHGMFLGVYDVDTAEGLHKAIKYGVSAVATNSPPMIIGELKKINMI